MKIGNLKRPRISVFRSNKHIYVQIIDDVNHQTLLTYSSLTLTLTKTKSNKSNLKITKTKMARKIGMILGEKAKQIGIYKLVFDRNGYLYHGRVKALAEGLRKTGLKF
ncbi:50S ribosomal protein L18 [Candidatus Karelsulcia muelleri]